MNKEQINYTLMLNNYNYILRISFIHKIWIFILTNHLRVNHFNIKI